jgi:hypothetical protein
MNDLHGYSTQPARIGVDLSDLEAWVAHLMGKDLGSESFHAWFMDKINQMFKANLFRVLLSPAEALVPANESPRVMTITIPVPDNAGPEEIGEVLGFVVERISDGVSEGELGDAEKGKVIARWSMTEGE